MKVTEELLLGDEPDAVPRARRFTAGVLAELDRPDLVEDAQLVVSELLTNAVLHGQPPVLLRVTRTGAGARIEVRDGSRLAPIRARPGPDTMTGRGLSMVEAIATRWGAIPHSDGKSVWCELDTPTADRDRTVLEPTASTELAPEAEIDAVLEPYGIDEEVPAPRAEPTYTVVLGDVPTDLLLAAKAHIDNLVREFSLAASGARSGATAAVPGHLASLIETVSQRFTDARTAIKRQALEAAARGEPRTRLTLTLPLSAADAGDAYLAAIDDADSYARAVRLLTLESPPQHRAFRQWYVQSLVSQLRAHAAGRTPPAPPSFEQRLLAELETVSSARRIADRAARLQGVTAALSGAGTIDEVTAVVVREGLEALEATSGSVLLRADHDLIDVSSAVGYPEQVVEAMRREAVDAELPGATVLRTGVPVWLETRHEIAEQFPGLGELEPRTQSLCAVPAAVGDRVLGALRFSFVTPRLFDEHERSFILALAAQAGQALGRSSAYVAERAARAAAESLASRLRRLQQVTGELAATTDAQQVADIVVTHAADALAADTAAVCLFVDDATLSIVATRGVTARAVEKFRAFPLDAALPASEAVRTGALIVVATRAELLRRYPDLASEAASDGCLVSAPMQTGDRRLGAITLRFPVAQEEIDDQTLAFLTSLADTAGQAIARAQAQMQAREATNRLAFLADASAELASSLDYRVTLTNVARLVVPRLADWCAIQLVEGDGFETVAVAHVDPAKVAFAEEMQQRYPTDPTASFGVPQVVRTGRAELYPTISDEMLVAGAIDGEHLRISRELGLSSALVVPLTGRQGTFGALTMVHAESGRAFSESDRSFTEEVARRAAIAVETAREFHQQSGRLAAITRVAEAAQHAILAPVPQRAGPVELAGAYVSAAREALVGGDLYEVVTLPGSVRLLIGDVRGKGLDAVRLATVVLGYFRSAAVDAPALADAARQVDMRLVPHLGDEDFVTALLVEIHLDGRTEVLSCGHPWPLRSDSLGVFELTGPPSLPLGLGSAPEPVSLVLEPGDRLLLYTDGLVEARDSRGEFTDLLKVAKPLRTAPLDTVLEHILTELRDTVGGSLDDDLALLVAEYRPLP